jgi:methylated-DNA-[protein]-cysteine S-methyltransferase
MQRAVIQTPMGPLGLNWDGDTLTGVDLEPQASAFVDGESASGSFPDQIPEPIRRQLDAYFADGHSRFDLPLAAGGTAFQHRVWSLMAAIPPGCTRTYGELARELASAPRAVGQACRANPLPIVLPCHRVVGAQGLGGFAGDTSGRKLAVKRWLLRHEGVVGV